MDAKKLRLPAGTAVVVVKGGKAVAHKTREEIVVGAILQSAENPLPEMTLSVGGRWVQFDHMGWTVIADSRAFREAAVRQLYPVCRKTSYDRRCHCCGRRWVDFVFETETRRLTRRVCRGCAARMVANGRAVYAE